jgi:ribonuclease-3
MTDELQERLGYRFQRTDLLMEALTHPSYSSEHHQPPPHYERLEFLGDAVLQLCVSGWLFTRHPDLDEGGLTRLRSTLTDQGALDKLARHLDLGRFLRLGRGERRAGGADRASLLADSLEAMIGAIYLDGGLAAATAFWERLLAASGLDLAQLLIDENPKGRLQERAQEDHAGTLPEYQVQHLGGPDHAPEFEVRVLLAGRELAVARAGSRRDAEKEAARLALKRLEDEAAAPPGAPPP